MNEIVISGKINSDGKLMIAQDEEYQNFLFSNKLCRVNIKVQALSDTDPELSQWYFERVIVPKFQKGLEKVGYQYNPEETIDFIKENSPFRPEEIEDTRYYHKLIEWAKQYCAENLNVVINDSLKG